MFTVVELIISHVEYQIKYRFRFLQVTKQQKLPISADDRRRRCRETKKNQPEKIVEVKRRDFKRCHARKGLLKT